MFRIIQKVDQWQLIEKCVIEVGMSRILGSLFHSKFSILIGNTVELIIGFTFFSLCFSGCLFTLHTAEHCNRYTEPKNTQPLV